MANRWSTSEAPRVAQFQRWRELICEAFLDLTPESDLHDGFVGTVIQQSLGDLNIARIDSQRQHVRRTDGDIERATHRGYYANFQLRGTSLTTQNGRSTVLRPGDLALVDTTEPFALDFRDDFRQLSFYLPAHLLDDQVHASVPTATRVATTAGVGAAIRHALLALDAGNLAEATANRLAIHTCGLLAVIFDQPQADTTTPVRHDRLHAAAIADMDDHLTDDDFSPATTARRLGVSVRLLYAVFAGREFSFAAEVRRRRLDCAWRDLQDPAKSHLRIIDVAVEAGFTDVTSFHRAFRRAYGRTPAHVRSTSPS